MYGFLTYQRWKFRYIIFNNVKLFLLSHFNSKLTLFLYLDDKVS